MIQVEQLAWEHSHGWRLQSESCIQKIPQLVLVFGYSPGLLYQIWFAALREKYPLSHIVSCVTANNPQEINTDCALTATVISFERTSVKVLQVPMRYSITSYQAGLYIKEMLHADNLAHIFVIGDSNLVNGGGLANGLSQRGDSNVLITGGLAGDNQCKQGARIGINEEPAEGRIAAIGFYGETLNVSHEAWKGYVPTEENKSVAANSTPYEQFSQPQLALLVRSVGSEIAVGQANSEMPEGISKLKSKSALTGFTSGGEIFPPAKNEWPQYHQLTVSYTAYSEE